MIFGMRKLRALGYRRIGMVTSNDMNERMDRMWTAAYHAELPVTTRSASVPICLLSARTRPSAPSDNPDHKQQLLKWYRTHKPEAIITPTTPVVEWLTEEGYEVPKDVAVACTSLHYEGVTTGIIEPSREIGCAAANFLVGMLQRGEYGIPALPQRVLMEGTWYTAKPTGKHTQAVPISQPDQNRTRRKAQGKSVSLTPTN